MTISREVETVALTPRQKSFVEKYLVSGNAAQAAIEAGYAPKSARSQGSKLLAMPAVQDYRRELEQKLFDELGISKAWIGRRLAEIVERCMSATPVLIWSDSERQKVESGFWTFDAQGAMKALHELYVQLGYAAGNEETAEQRQSFEDWLAAQGDSRL